MTQPPAALRRGLVAGLTAFLTFVAGVTSLAVFGSPLAPSPRPQSLAAAKVSLGTTTAVGGAPSATALDVDAASRDPGHPDGGHGGGDGGPRG